MPTLLDTAEFALAKATLDTTLQRIEKARQDRLESLRRERAINQASLENAKRWVREFPIDIARQDAEIARLEATTGGDILREAMSAHEVVLHAQPPGEVVEVQSPLLDLRTVKFGSDLVIADAGLCDVARSVALIQKGELFRVEREAMETADWPDQPRVKIEVVETGYQCFIAAIQRAHPRTA